MCRNIQKSSTDKRGTYSGSRKLKIFYTSGHSYEQQTKITPISDSATTWLMYEIKFDTTATSLSGTNWIKWRN